MATIKGVMRSYGAAVRKMEREQQREAREATKRFKEQQKLQEIEDAGQAVIDWENYIDILQSVHKNCTDSIDWGKILNSPKPKEPKAKSDNEILAQNKFDNFKPSFFDKIFGSTKRKKDNLFHLVEQAKIKDKKENDVKLNEYNLELKNWKELQKISKGILDKDVNSFLKAIDYFEPFSDIGELGTNLTFNINSSYVDIDLRVNSVEIIPDYELRLTSTGKLSRKNMTKSKFNELYQDHICSSIIRVSREMFAYLPIDYVRINAISDILNSKTGHLEETPILSVILPPDTINKLNLETIDPSDSMQNFVHNMKFNKTKGFSGVQKVNLTK